MKIYKNEDQTISTDLPYPSTHPALHLNNTACTRLKDRLKKKVDIIFLPTVA